MPVDPFIAQILRERARVFNAALKAQGITTENAHEYHGRLMTVTQRGWHPADAVLILDGVIICRFHVGVGG